MSSDSEQDYEVGYGKPPLATRFQKGTSGNPSGRPKKASGPFDPGIVLQAIDNETIIVTDNGKRKQMTKVEVNFRQLFAKATKGDLAAARLILRMATKYFGPEGQTYAETELITPKQAARRFGRNWQECVAELNARAGNRI
jgi:hypothetical protein